MLIWLILACGSEKIVDMSSVEIDTNEPMEGHLNSYTFQNAEGESSVSYSGQVCRQVLINDIKAYISDLDSRISTEVVIPDEVLNGLGFYFETAASVGDDVEHSFNTDIDALQQTYGAISSGKNLIGKIAGNDSATDHKDWSRDFRGWGVDSGSPLSLVEDWFMQLDEQALNWGNLPLNVLGESIDHVYLTPEGQDLKQLIEKFLRASVSFSQGTDDYLDDDVEGKGLLASHIPEEGKKYSPLEHAWDEGFGYFGAARTYPQWTDDEIADLGYQDVDGSGTIDLLSEVNWGHSVNAAKRDRGVEGVDFTADAWEGFIRGRELLSKTVGTELTESELEELKVYRDQAVWAWEAAIAATSIHYINDMHQDLAEFGSEDFSFSTTAKHFSELKGFSLSFQFNPRSAVSDSSFQTFHDLIGTAPNFNSVESYRADLEEAKQIIGDSFGFDASYLGDENGEDGW